MIYELKIELFNVDTPPYRYVQLQSDTSFNQLHFIIQVLFDWSGVQSHAFLHHEPEKSKVIGKKRLKNHPGFSYLADWPIYEEQDEKLEDWLTDIHDTMVYEYYEYESENWLYNIELVGIYKNEDEFNRARHSDEEKINLPPFNEIVFPICTKARYLSPFESFVRRIKSLKKNSILPEADSEDDELFSEDLVLPDFFTEKMHEKVPIISAPYTHQTKYYYDKLLEATKRYYYHRPWEIINESQIFVVTDPETEEQLFVSINGSDGKAPGINVFAGENSFSNIYQSSLYYEAVKSAQGALDKLTQFHGLGLLLYGDIDSGKVNYFFNESENTDTPIDDGSLDEAFHRIDPYFFSISKENNNQPSPLSIEEMRWMILAVEQTLKVYEQVQKGLDLPSILDSNAVLERAYSERYGHFINREIRIYFK